MRLQRTTLLFVALSLAACDAQVSKEETTKEVSEYQTLSSPIPIVEGGFTNVSSVAKAFNADMAQTEQGGLSVAFDSAANTNSTVSFEPSVAWDWSSLKDFNIAFTISNPGAHSVQLYLDITDKNGDNYTRTTSVGVGKKNVFYAKMTGHDLGEPDDTDLNFGSGLRSNPDTWESDEVQFTSMWGKRNLDLSGIQKIALSVQHAVYDKKIVIHNIELRPNPEFNTEYLTKIVDKFGQNATVEFDGKIHDDAELLKQRADELASFKKELPSHLSQFSGWKDGPKLEATGYFRTQKHEGKWYLVDPEGYLYFATGIDIIRLSNSTTMTGYDFPNPVFDEVTDNGVTPEDSKGLNRVSTSILDTRFVASEVRANMFEWLPDYNEPLGKHYGYRASAHSGPLKKGETYSFYSANLERKYSDINPDFLEVWEDVTINRMRNWGFSSLGNWTDPRYYDNTRMPFFANGWIIGDYKTVSSGNDFWSPLPDVFDPEFEERAHITVKYVASEVKNTPWCVGVFIDNEKSFGRSETPQAQYGIVIHTLGRDGKDVPTKQAFTDAIKAKYVDIDALNKAWDKNIASWEAFNTGIDSSLTNDKQLKDYGDLLFLYAEKYFSVIRGAMDMHMPNHLYLGSRFPDWGMPKEVVAASAKHVDVVSYNVYKEGLHPQKWSFLSELDMPSIIGEFHVGALDSGLYHPGLIHASDQEDRAKIYSDYMKTVIDNPYFVGAHWFQYIDSPITGRAYDGENYNVGFVTVTDVPYEPMIKAAKELHATMYERRAGK